MRGKCVNMKFKTKIINWIHTKRYKSHISGKGRLLYTRDSHFILHKNSKIYLNGNLNLNANSFGENGRTSLLRMDQGAKLTVNGNFSFMYGADIILFPNAELTLNAGSFINSDCKIRCSHSIEIGRDCAISHDFTIMDSDVHYLNGSNNTYPVKIGNHVWIGTRVTILSGVTVGDGAVIAAGSLVKNDVPAHSLVAGVPAKVVRENIEWEK